MLRLLLLLLLPAAAASYSASRRVIVYPLYQGEDCASPPCNEDYSCAHTCYLHGLECDTEGFDCQAEAVKFCGGKELTLLIPGYCDRDLCDVDCDLGVYYSSQEHLGISLCNSGMAPFCPRHYSKSLCQCALPAASEDLYHRDVASQAVVSYKFFGCIAFVVVCMGAAGVKTYRSCCKRREEDLETFTESELAFLSQESGEQVLPAGSEDALLGRGSGGVDRGEGISAKKSAGGSKSTKGSRGRTNSSNSHSGKKGDAAKKSSRS